MGQNLVVSTNLGQPAKYRGGQECRGKRKIGLMKKQQHIVVSTNKAEITLSNNWFNRKIAAQFVFSPRSAPVTLMARLKGDEGIYF